MSYIVRATLAITQQITVSPRRSGTVITNAVSTTDTGTLIAISSVSATFMVSTTGGAVTLDFVYNGSTTATSPTGYFDVVEVQ